MNEQQVTDRPVRPSVGYYDQIAEDWDHLHGRDRQNLRFARQVRENLQSILADLPAAPQALEIGAGTGPYIEMIAPRVGRLTATDLSEGMLRVMARRVASLGLTNVTVMRADACDLSNFEANSLDIVYSIGLLETVPNLELLFANVHRVLKPGGIVAGITSNGNCPWYLVRHWLEGTEKHGRTGQLVTASMLADLLSRIGFDAAHINYWGALPPSVQSELLNTTFGAIETLIVRSPLARLLGAMTFRSMKFDSMSKIF